jgi:hypothetical protein
MDGPADDNLLNDRDVYPTVVSMQNTLLIWTTRLVWTVEYIADLDSMVDRRHS